MRRKTLFILLCILFSPPIFISSVAQSAKISPNNAVAIIKDCNISTVESLTIIKTFVLEVLEEGDYYASMWSNPALCNTGTYTPLYVSINEMAASEIKFTKGNWQSVVLNDYRPIHLRKGTNSIAISCQRPAIPNIECIYVSNDLHNVCISNDKYSDYLEKAKSGQHYNEILSTPKSIHTKSADFPSFYVQENVPLKYSFHTSCYFTQNQEVHFATSSTIPHVVDIFYYGSEKRITADSLFSISNKGFYITPTSMAKSIGDFTTVQIPPKITMMYTPATADEIQGLNWKRISQRNASIQDRHFTDFTINFHKEGFYMVKLRSIENQTLGVADLTIDNLTYESVPMYYSAIDCTMPADGKPYAAAALRNSEPLSDPMLFVEGNDGLRVVGYSDDNGGTILGEQINKGKDAFIKQTYYIDTQRLHVCNYSSENPEGNCIIIGGASDEDDQNTENSPTELSVKASKKHTYNSFSPSISDARKAPQPNNNVISIDIFDISGKRIKTCQTTSGVHSLLVNIPGVYIIQTTTESGTYREKLIIPQP